MKKEPMPPARAARQVNNYLELLAVIFETVSEKAQVDVRRDLLLAHILKAQSISNAVLLIGQYFYVEEVIGLTRTLAEVVVNACYLLVCDDIEVSRYMKFDFVKGPSRTRKLREHIPDPVDYPQDMLDNIMRNAAEAQAEINRTTKDSVWSQKSLEQRAEYVDERWEKVQLKTMVLAEAAHAHSSVHATMSSLVWFIEQAAGLKDEPDDERARALGLALHGTAFCLFEFCVALNERYSLGADDRLRDLQTAP